MAASTQDATVQLLLRIYLVFVHTESTLGVFGAQGTSDCVGPGWRGERRVASGQSWGGGVVSGWSGKLGVHGSHV